MELTAADRPAPQLGGDVDRALVAHLGHQPEAPLADPEGVGRPGLETERGIERYDLGPAAEAAVAAAAKLDLARQGDEPARRSTVRLQPPAAARARERCREGRFESPDHLVPEPYPDLSESRADRPLERADVGVLGRQADLERDRTLHREPLQMLACLTTPA